ncbi:MAG: hypothetical protein J6A37_11620 [Oscillospiraceae bacterium]|nr:hypothetical protein [Oscillospiraceae bacterium]
MSKMKNLILMLAVSLMLSGCGENEVVVNEEADITEFVSETPQLSEVLVSETTATISEITTISSETETTSEISMIYTDHFSQLPLSRDYELDLKKYTEDKQHVKYSLQQELFFLNEEQYETYLRALVFIDEIEYYYITNTNGTPYWLDENGKFYDNYYYADSDGTTIMVPYSYVSSYKSFYEYLQSVFTDAAIAEIMNNDRFYTVDGELYFKWGEKGGAIYFQDGQYRLVKSDENEMIFEYLAHQCDDENEWTETHTIKLVNTDNGWRCELFDYLYS